MRYLEYLITCSSSLSCNVLTEVAQPILSHYNIGEPVSFRCSSFSCVGRSLPCFVMKGLAGASPDLIWVRRDFPEAGLIKLLLIKCRRRPLCSVPQSCCVTIVTPRLTTTFHTTLPWLSANFVVIFLCLKLTSLVIFSNFFRGIHS